MIKHEAEYLSKLSLVATVELLKDLPLRHVSSRRRVASIERDRVLVHAIERASFIKLNRKLCNGVESFIVTQFFAFVANKLKEQSICHEMKSKAITLVIKPSVQNLQ